MPNATTHLLLAGRVLRRWARPGADAPFAVDDARATRAFLHGSLSPDAGYFPRGDRLFSELAHLARTGDLARALVEEARTPAQRAHAWGWATHLLGDVAIHPLINAAHGERVRGSRHHPVTSTEDEAGHMRLEFGLDAALFAAFPEVEDAEPGAGPEMHDLGHVERAYRRVYGWGPTAAWVAGAHRTTGWMARLSRMINLAFTARASRRPLHALLRVGARTVAPPRFWLPGRWNRSAPVLAVLSPLRPPSWLVGETAEVVEGFAAWVDGLRAGGLAGLANHDLVTGEREQPGNPTPRAAEALRLLAARAEAPALRPVWGVAR